MNTSNAVSEVGLVAEALREQKSLDRMSTHIRWAKDLRQTLFWRAAALYLVVLTFYYGTAASTSNENVKELLWVFPPLMFAGSLAMITQDLINVFGIRKATKEFREAEESAGLQMSSSYLLQSSLLGDIRFIWLYIGFAILAASILIHDYGVTWLKFF